MVTFALGYNSYKKMMLYLNLSLNQSKNTDQTKTKKKHNYITKKSYITWYFQYLSTFRLGYVHIKVCFWSKNYLETLLSFLLISVKVKYFLLESVQLSKNIIKPAGGPRGAWAFDKLKRYHPRTSQFGWDHKNLHFGEMHFKDPNIDIGILFTN